MRYESDAHRIIIDELSRHTKTQLAGKPRVAIPCPFHNETQPSLYVNLERTGKYGPGTYLCFGCGAKPSTHGGWNGLAAKLGLRTIAGGEGQVTSHVTRKISIQQDTQERTWQTLVQEWGCGLTIPWPIGMKFRGLPGWLVRKVGGYLSLDSHDSQMCLLPQWDGDDLIGGVKAKVVVKPWHRVKYLSAPGAWVKTKGLLTMETVRTMLQHTESRDVMLVEGSRDAIRMIGCGIPALPILGTNNWTEEKRDYLMSLDPDRVFLGFDNDRAGKQATALVYPMLKGYCQAIKLEFESEGQDPGNVPIDIVKGWKRKHSISTVNAKLLPDLYK